MKNKKAEKYIFILFFSFLFFGKLAAQDQSFIDPELQKDFIIIENEHHYDLNPHTAAYSAEAQILTGLYEGLFSYDPVTLDPLYAIASSYRVSRDKKRWTFILRDDAKFSDGSLITAHDVKNAWISLLRNPNATYSSFFDIIKGAKDFRLNKADEENVAIRALDDKTISIHLITPASHLPKLLCMPAFSVCKEDLSVFSGAFCLYEYSQKQIILKKNPEYYDSEKTYLDQITIKISNDENENTFLFNTGNADWIASAFNTDKLLSKESIHLYAEFATQYFFFKVRQNSPCKYPEIRQALLEAVPWSKLRENTYVKATSLVYPLNGYPAVQGYLFEDSLEAKVMLEEAKKACGIPKDASLEVSFAIPDSEYMQKRAELLKEAWKALDVTLTIIPIPESLYLDSIPQTEADLFSYTWIGDFADPLAFLELFKSSSTLNVSNWKNNDFDALLDEATLYSDEEHNKLLSKAEQLLLDDAVILPIQHPVSINIINLNTVGGWSINAFDIHPLKYLFKKNYEEKIPNLVRLTK